MPSHAPVSRLLVVLGAILVASCADAPPADLTAGEVRQWLHQSLANDGAGAACFDGDPSIQAEPLLGGDAYDALSDLGIEDGSDLGRYLDGLREAPTTTRAVSVTVDRDERRRYLYLPNDGSYGIERVREDSLATGRGILVDLGGAGAATRTCVTCTVQSGQRGQGCTCTNKTVTVCCTTAGCSPTCGTGYQCPYSCNRSDPAPWDRACPSTDPFEDPRPFATLTPGVAL